MSVVVRREEQLLGALAVRQGLCTPEQVEECLRMQSMASSAAPLGDLLVFKGYLTAVQVRELLSQQHKRLMACPSCALSFTVLTLSEGKPVRCPKCRGPLADRRPGAPMRTDAEFETGPVRITTPSAGPQVPRTCIICEEPFEAAADPSGRVRCPACGSTFSASSR